MTLECIFLSNTLNLLIIFILESLSISVYELSIFSHLIPFFNMPCDFFNEMLYVLN